MREKQQKNLKEISTSWKSEKRDCETNNTSLRIITEMIILVGFRDPQRRLNPLGGIWDT